MRLQPVTRLRFAAAPLGFALVLALGQPAWAEGIAVIVHPEREADGLAAEVIAQIYLKQRGFWPEGEAIVPINREAGSAIREGFSRRVLGRRASKLRSYWNRRYFQGVLPPATLASDEAVRRFVAAEPRAIGYVSASAVDGSVRVVLSIESPQ